LKRADFKVAVIDVVFCLDARVEYERETLSVVTLEWSEVEVMSFYFGKLNDVNDGGDDVTIFLRCRF